MEAVETEDRPSFTTAVFVRLTADDRAYFEAAAAAEDRTVANWLRRLGRKAVERDGDDA